MKKGLLLILGLILTVSLVGCQTLASGKEPAAGVPEIDRDIQPEPDIGQIEPAIEPNNDQSPSVITPTKGNDSTDENKLVDPNTPVQHNAEPAPVQGITVNKIPFNSVNDADLSNMIKQAIEKNKEKRGYEIFLDETGTFVLVVYAGEKNSGGYGIRVVSIEDNEGVTNVVVEETEPAPGSMVIMAITYPYHVVSITGTTDNFKVVNAEGEVFKQIK